jgi:hypothetical protein
MYAIKILVVAKFVDATPFAMAVWRAQAVERITGKLLAWRVPGPDIALRIH